MIMFQAVFSLAAIAIGSAAEFLHSYTLCGHRLFSLRGYEITLGWLPSTL